jgi:pimeloyl-ACP methyl ester carboxylesterase
MLHGLASSSRYWGDLRPLSHEYHVLTPDLLGFGRSPKPRDAQYTPDDHVRAIRRALQPRLDKPTHLLGHSLGSVIALHYAATYPADVRSVTLISLPVIGNCAWGHRTDGSMARWHRFCVHSRPGAAIFSAGMRAVAPVWYRVGPSLRRGVPPEANRDALAATWTSYWRSLEEVVYRTDLRSLIGRVQTPIHLIHGPNDFVAPIGPVRVLATELSLPLTEIPIAGHNPFYTQRPPTVRAIQTFLREVEDQAERTKETASFAAGD